VEHAVLPRGVCTVLQKQFRGGGVASFARAVESSLTRSRVRGIEQRSDAFFAHLDQQGLHVPGSAIAGRLPE
jgi:hypothetical protein